MKTNVFKFGFAEPNPIFYKYTETPREQAIERGKEALARDKKGGSRNLVGIAIQLSDSEEEEFFVGYSMLISPEKFDFGIE